MSSGYWVVAFLALSGCLIAQTSATTRHGTLVRTKVHGAGLEGNLEGDSPDRDVSIYLPPSYSVEKHRRYPVVYVLHGFTDDDKKWNDADTPHFIKLPAVTDKSLANGDTREMILVMPNAYTRFQGSMYSKSVTVGDWEQFISQDLVSWVDQHYRTIRAAASRGLAGHSMGGYGTMGIGMKHPEVFSSIYLLSPCCMAAGGPAPRSPKMEAIHTIEDFEKADFLTKAAFASAAAWSPNPKNPPFFLDLPVKDGRPQPAVEAKWAANAPLAMIDQHIPELKRLHAIALDAGSRDEPIATTVRDLDRILTDYGIPHAFEIYEGNHLDHIAERVGTKMLPFFSKNLTFERVRH
ncbi:MAG: alpha/beta hydrolase-fold protein [Bryobacteraceae bacterium]|jgi:enterochelin esterase-like enzyme